MSTRRVIIVTGMVIALLFACSVVFAQRGGFGGGRAFGGGMRMGGGGGFGGARTMSPSRAPSGFGGNRSISVPSAPRNNTGFQQGGYWFGSKKETSNPTPSQDYTSRSPIRTGTVNRDGRTYVTNYYGGMSDYSYRWNHPVWYMYTPFHPSWYYHPPVYVGGVAYPGEVSGWQVFWAVLIFIVLIGVVMWVTVYVTTEYEKA